MQSLGLPRRRVRRTSRVAAAIALSSFAHIASAQLSFDMALELAEQQAPSVLASRGRAESARLSSVTAAELPDPKLSVGVENLPIEGMDRFSLTRDFMTMRRVGVMQEVPNRDKRNARAAVASARITRAEAEQRLASISVRRETAVAWVRRFAIERQLTRLQDLERENRLLEATVRAQLAGGKGSAADAVMPRQEAALLEDRRDELLAQRAVAIASLERFIGPSAANLELVGGVPAWPIVAASLLQRVTSQPEVAAIDAMATQLDAEVREATSMKRPDWAVELAYQRRGAVFGDMVSVMFSFDLPLFGQRRQDPLIAAKLAERRSADAEREAILRERRQVLASDLAELERLDRALSRLRDRLLPLADERIALTSAAYRSGTGALLDVIAARRERLDLLLRSEALQGERDATAARLHFASDVHATYGEQR